MTNYTSRLATLGGGSIYPMTPVILWAGTIYTNKNSTAWYATGNGIIGLGPIIVAPNTNNTVLRITTYKNLCDYYTILSMHATLQCDSYNDNYKTDADRGGNEGPFSVPQLKYENPYIYYKQWMKTSTYNQSWDDDSKLGDSSRRLEISLTVVGYAG